MDYRLFIVSLPFLLSLLFAILFLTYIEYSNQYTETSKSNDFINGIISKNMDIGRIIINKEDDKLNLKNIILNVSLLSIITFLTLIFITIYL